MFDRDDFLDLAERLASEADDEAALRSAISRVYYAAYHAAALFVRSRGILLSGHTHQRIWLAIVTGPDADRVRIGQQGDRLRRLRIQADYRKPFPGDLTEAALFAMDRARLLIAEFDRLG